MEKRLGSYDTKACWSFHRPIFILQNISNDIENMIANRLSCLIPVHQNLFILVRVQSISNAIAQLIGDITNGGTSNGKNKTTAVTFLNLDKAFERTQPQAILGSLIILGFKGKILAWLQGLAFKQNHSSRTPGIQL